MRRYGPALLLASAWAALALHARHYWPFLSDDALISLRYADRLAHGHGLTWSGTERVEGYTDLLWVLLTALAAKLGAALVPAARVLDAIGAATAIAAVACSPRPLSLRPVRLLTGGVALALCAPLAVWAIGALEHGFMAGVIAVALLLLARRQRLAAGAALAAIALLRADGVVLVCAALLGEAICERSVRAALKLGALPVFALLAQLAFRIAYYGELVPNTAVAKVTFSHGRLVQGLHYVEAGFTPLWPMLVACAVLCALGARGLRRERWVPALLMTLAWSAYQVLVGGDIFPAWRQLLPGIIPIATLLAEGAEATAARWRRGVIIAPALALPLCAYGLVLQTADGGNRRGVTERWEFDGVSAGPMLARAFADEKPLLAVDAAGALPFYSGLACVDMLGLNDKYLAKHPPRGFGTGQIGHELGNGAYVLQRRPDIIAFNNAAGARDPMFRSGREMIGTSEFKNAYELVRAKSRVVSWLWIRREGGVLGVTRAADRIAIPGYFFATGDAIARPDTDGKLVTFVDAPARLPELEVPPGTWKLELEPAAPAARVRFRCDGLSALPPGDTIAVDAPTRLDVFVQTTGAPFVIRSAALRRASGPAARCPDAGAVPGLRLDELGSVAEGAAWDAPDALAFGDAGVEIRLPSTSHVRELDVALDANDVYAVELRSGTTVVASLVAGPVRGMSGIRTRRLVVPDVAALAGFDAIRIRPRGGDGAYSLGRIALVP